MNRPRTPAGTTAKHPKTLTEVTREIEEMSRNTMNELHRHFAANPLPHPGKSPTDWLAESVQAILSKSQPPKL
jgi:hypothetical protein